ncbi:PTS beta-glucoside transporter subunit IIBCA [Granulicatella sp. zg-ZJ]|uniref:beta-glucoside-specific PTS transporter subunit IIABC n=1 Tax=Granulicatella sp. zg-ZJ TaxID=2678504 RepID=UPI0013D11B48|nr:beta-glucoside-specific PTS transporter subunit IIABC [Granulicatella sp. zg-ZJ]NEW62160.1 PTS beta-glucoside transporter subunit IIBCA [Granulicatella sp. zg-ZJ]
MNYKKVAEDVLKHIGGKENISHFEHCSTRLRFTLVNNDKVNISALESIDGVVGVRQNVQTQIIIGNEVNEVYEEVRKLVGEVSASTTPISNKKVPWTSVFLDFLVGVFQPLVPAIAGGGVLKSILLLLNLCGILPKDSTAFVVFNQIGDAPLYFLPLLVAVSTAKKLKVNELVAASAVGVLLLPAVTKLLTEGLVLFGLSVQNIAYAYQVFPAILTVLLYAVLEKQLTKYTPKPIRIFFVPMMSLAITVPITLFILGPLGFNFGQLFSTVILFLFRHLGWVATALLASVLPFMVATGMHKAMLPYAIATMGELHKEILYLPASLAHNISESGASFAVALKTKDEKLRATAMSSGISALFGITEPALYGVTLQHKAVLYSVVLSSLISGAFIGIVAVEAFALVGPGLASMTMFTNPANPMNLVWAFVGFVLAFVIAFVATFIQYKEQEKDTTIRYISPVEGNIVPLEQVNDDVFSSKLVGEGIAIEPTSDGVLVSPFTGTVEVVYETGHAVMLKDTLGAEVLFHIGIDTVKLNGMYFTKHVENGAIVNKGDVLVTFDVEKIKQEGYDPTVMMIVTNHQHYNIHLSAQTHTTTKDILLTIDKKGE